MALPSQMSSSSSGRVHRSSTPQAPRPWAKPVGIAVFVVALVLGVWALGKYLPFAKSKQGQELASQTPAGTSAAGLSGSGAEAAKDEAKASEPWKEPPKLLFAVADEKPAEPSTPQLKLNDVKVIPPTPFGLGDQKSGSGATSGPTSGSATPGATDPSKPSPTDVTNPTGEPAKPAAPEIKVPGPTALPPNPVLAAEPTAPTASSSPVVLSLMQQGDAALRANKLVEARSAYSKALLSAGATRGEQESLREKLTRINEDMVFSSKTIPGDPFAMLYVVEAGDNPTTIRKRQQLATEVSLITRINKFDPKKLRVGQKLKLLTGPFHAVVSKSDYRLDLFMGPPEEPERWVYVKSFRVGLGEANSTPTGSFFVKKNSKLTNPYWTNPRTGEKFEADDPKNPIGEFWVGIEGLGGSALHTGYGLHGTIDPGSIGQQKSMGCVRLMNDDIAMLYDLLVPEISLVNIVP